MGCSCLGTETKIKSNISTNGIIYFNKVKGKKTQDIEDESFQDFLKSFKAKIIIDSSNISSSCLSLSDDDVHEYSKRVN